MNQKGFARYNTISGFTHLFLLVVIIVIGIGGLLYYSLQKGLIKKASTTITRKNESIEIVEVSLDINSPFSEARIVVNKDRTITYSVMQENQKETRSNTITKEQLKSLNNLILENDYFSLEEKPKNPGDQEDGSYYYLNVKYYPGDPLEPTFPSQKTVYCYEFNCAEDFLEIKDKIIELLGDQILSTLRFDSGQ